MRPRPWGGWPEHPVLFVLISAYVAAGFVVAWLVPIPGMMAAFRSTLFIQLTTLIAVPYASGLAMTARLKARGPAGERLSMRRGWATAWRDLRRGAFSGQQLRDLVILTLAIGLFSNSFSCWKSALGALPFAWDARLARLDSVLLGGLQPWLALQSALGHPTVTRVIDATYEAGWFSTMVLVLLAYAWSPPGVDRTRFFLGFVLTCILLGSGLAALLRSAGPCYYARVHAGGDPYHGMLAYLAAVNQATPLASFHIREELWRLYVDGQSTAGGGIAAMPSMHVSMPILFAAALWTRRRRLAIAFAIYTAVILISAVHLGWHYAVDGYASILGVLLIWRGVCWLFPPTQSHEAVSSRSRRSTQRGSYSGAALLLVGASTYPNPGERC